ncbi:MULTISPECIES: hypothetical protein [Nitrosomonas]|uniref:hypothetical protein n=1 Tax=Nitrosomonas TaxID=914 RepID=UPI000AB95672|nr:MULTISPECIES: hypothetical protein [Nitrosomonas]
MNWRLLNTLDTGSRNQALEAAIQDYGCLHRSGRSVHQRGIYFDIKVASYPDQYGW